MGSATRDTVVTRLAVLTTAMAILCVDGLPVVASEVLDLAIQLEALARR
jgi:hypothetical protein